MGFRIIRLVDELSNTENTGRGATAGNSEALQGSIGVDIPALLNIYSANS